jgi:antitoxin CcdA
MREDLRISYAQMPAPNSRKTATNLSLRADLVKRAKALGLNLSEVLDAALEQAVKEAEGRSWLEENREAIDQYNAMVAKHGVFSDGRRRF